MWENVQCNTGKHDYPKISRDTGKKTLDKWVWIAKGPGVAALKFPVFFTRDNVKFRWSLLDRHHHLSITAKFLKSATKILVHVMSPVPKQAAQIQESLASFPQWNWDRKEAGNNNHSRKHSPRLMQEGTRHAAGSQHIPEGLLLKASGSGAVRAATACHRDLWHLSYPLVLKTMFASSNHFPHVPAWNYAQEPVFALFKALLGKGAVRSNLHSLPGSWWIGWPTCVPVLQRKTLISPQSKAGIYNEPNSAKFSISCAPRISIDEQICLYTKWISSIVMPSSTML